MSEVFPKPSRLAGAALVAGLALFGCASAFGVQEDADSGSPPVPSADATRDDAGAIPPPPPRDAGVDGALGRVTDGLVAFFGFREDAGTIVHDTAPEGGRLELVVARAPAPDGDGGVLPVPTSGPTVAWTSPGMSVVGRVVVASAQNASLIESRCNTTNELTVEAWIKPSSVTQGGPARIVTMSHTGVVRNRNFTLGQAGDSYVFRIRNEELDAGIVEVRSDGGAGLALTHVAVVVRANGSLTFWIDGTPTTSRLPAGAFSFQPFRLGLANEIDGFDAERLWRGDYRLVAIYCRALSEAEVRRNRELGPNP